MQTRGMWPAGQADDKQRFLADMRALRDEAALGYDELAARTHYPDDILKDAESGPSLPGLPVLAAYVRACEGDVPAWEERWRRLGFDAPRGDADLPARAPGASPAAVAGARASAGVAPPDAYNPEHIRAVLRGISQAEQDDLGTPGRRPRRPSGRPGPGYPPGRTSPRAGAPRRAAGPDPDGTRCRPRNGPARPTGSRPAGTLISGRTQSRAGTTRRQRERLLRRVAGLLHPVQPAARAGDRLRPGGGGPEGGLRPGPRGAGRGCTRSGRCGHRPPEPVPFGLAAGPRGGLATAGRAGVAGSARDRLAGGHGFVVHPASFRGTRDEPLRGGQRAPAPSRGSRPGSATTCRRLSRASPETAAPPAQEQPAPQASWSGTVEVPGASRPDLASPPAPAPRRDAPTVPPRTPPEHEAPRQAAAELQTPARAAIEPATSPRLVTEPPAPRPAPEAASTVTVPAAERVRRPVAAEATPARASAEPESSAKTESAPRERRRDRMFPVRLLVVIVVAALIGSVLVLLLR